MLYASVIFMSGMFFTPTIASAATGMWVTETVDNFDDVGLDSSLAVDSKGWVHISYYDATNRSLRHAVNAYGTWVVETVDGGAQGDDVGWYSSMAFDSAGRPHIGYFDVINGDLKHAYVNTSGDWVSEVVDGAGIKGEHTSLAIDPFDNIHISYYDRSSGVLMYATRAVSVPSAWSAQPVDSSSGDTGWYTSIAADSAGKVHISYYDSINMDLKYATNAGGSWVTETVDSTDDTGWDTSIAVDGSDRVHISYYDATNHDLRYSVRGAAGTWQGVTVDSVGDVGSYSSLFVDTAGIVHIGYHDYTNGTLKYAAGNTANISNGWDIATVDSSSADAGAFASLTTDLTGDVHISYYDGINGDLKYAVLRAPTNLKKGFNIISVPTNAQIIPDAFTFMGFIDPAGDGVSKVLRYNRTAMKVEQAYRSNGTMAGDNFTITAGDGLIVYALRDIAVDLLQDVCPLFNLSAGTNWVGTPCLPEHQTAFSVLQALGSASAISLQGFNPETGKFETAAYRNSQIVGTDFPIEGNRGYILHMKAGLTGFRP